MYIKRIFNESGEDLECARGVCEVHTGCMVWEDGGAENEDGGGGGAGRRGGGDERGWGFCGGGGREDILKNSGDPPDC